MAQNIRRLPKIGATMFMPGQTVACAGEADGMDLAEEAAFHVMVVRLVFPDRGKLARNMEHRHNSLTNS